MGLLVSRFRKKKNAEEKLEELTQKIQKIEEFLECDEDKLRVHVQQLVIYSVVIFVLILGITYILDPKPGRKYIFALLLLFPFIIYVFRKLIIIYYKSKIVRNKKKIEIYKKEKQKIIDDVMETEVYKVAKRILEKYDVPYSSKRFTPPKPSTPIPIPKPSPGSITPYQPSTLNSELRRRPGRDLFNQSQLMSAQRPVPPTLVRPVIPPTRGVFDKILEKFAGDGPSDRFALICQNCSSHNGMALQEEFVYLSYRCVFCGYFNPAKKQRPPIRPVVTNFMAIEGGGASDSDSSSERKPTLQITELEDSESESREDSHENKAANEGQDKTSPSQSEGSSPSHQTPPNKEPNVISESKTKDGNTASGDNTESQNTESCTESRVEGTEESNEANNEIVSSIENDQVSPMEVDEDSSTEHPCASETTKDS